MGIAQDLQALGGAGLGTALDAGITGAVNYGFGRLAANDAYQKQKNLMLKGPYLRMQGLKLAGLNPILAMGKMGGGTPTAAAVLPSSASSSAPHRQAKVAEDLAESQSRVNNANALSAENQATLNTLQAGLAALRYKTFVDNPGLMKDLVTNESLPNSLGAILWKSMFGAEGPGDKAEPRSSRDLQFMHPGHNARMYGRDFQDWLNSLVPKRWKGPQGLKRVGQDVRRTGRNMRRFGSPAQRKKGAKNGSRR